MSCHHDWRWEPYPLLPQTYIVRCKGCGVERYLVTVLYRGAGVFFAHQPYGG